MTFVRRHRYSWYTIALVGVFIQSPSARTAPPPSDVAGQGGEPPAACSKFPLDRAEIQREAEAGNAYCQAVLGALYFRGDLIETDADLALFWSKRAWEQEHPLGIYNQANLHASGEAKVETYRRARAALEAMPQNDAHVVDCLAIIITAGLDGSKPDLERGCAYRKQAADLNNVRSQFFYGEQCLRSKELGEDFAAAREWFERAAAGGLPAAAWAIGDIEREAGRLDEAMAQYQRAAEIGQSRDKLRMGGILERGELGEAQTAAALAMYLRAAQAGSSRANYRAAWIYFTGAEGVAPNVREAKRRFKAAARDGDLDAINMLQALGLP